jgi:predicted O-methyltransferase YrrM
MRYLKVSIKNVIRRFVLSLLNALVPGSKLSPPYRRVQAKSISKQYVNDCIEEMCSLSYAYPTSVNIDTANFYYAFTKNVRPQLIVEIGCFIGLSTQHFAQALSEIGFGKIISIDLFDFEVETAEGMMNRFEITKYYLAKAGLDGVTHIVKGASTEVRSNIKEDIKGKIDLLYIDGDHTVNGIFSDFNAYYNDVRKGGYILLHDIYPHMCGWNGPRILIDHLKQLGLVAHNIELLEFPTKEGYGISILRKINSEALHLDIASIRDCYPTSQDISHVAPVEVVVKNYNTGKPIPGATVSFKEIPVDGKGNTDNKGIFSLFHRGILPNRYVLEVSAEGYVTKKDVLIHVIYEQSLQQFEVKLKPM